MALTLSAQTESVPGVAPALDSTLMGKNIFTILPSRDKGAKADVTVHQSQGMTIPRTYVALDDIKLAKVTDQGGDTFARLLYVALSRASREIVILQDDLI